MSRTVSREEALLALPSLRTGGCAMCQLADPAHAPDDVALVSEHAVVRLDRFGASHGHLLVVLRGHETRAEALAWEPYEAMQRAAWRASRAVAAVLRPRRVWTAALGAPEPLPMSFPHCHVHVIPVHEGGEAARPARVLSWTNGVVVYDDGEALALVHALREALG